LPAQAAPDANAARTAESDKKLSPAAQRFTKSHPCPICGGHDGLVRGQQLRCFGYRDDSGTYARCTREERAGELPQNRDGTYSHRLQGACRCGQVHGEAIAPVVTNRRKAPRRATAQTFRSYFTLCAFLRRIYGQSATIRFWAYHNDDAREAFRILRVDHQEAADVLSKTYRPCYEDSDGRWHLSKPGGLLPLFHQPAVRAVPPGGIVPLLEGEKCACIAEALGLAHATTSAHGAKAPQLTDWSPLAGQRVAIVRDEGEGGADYAEKVSAILSALDPPSTVAVIRLPGLSDGEDVEQWVARRLSAGRGEADIRHELHALIAAAFV
jgi:hypothetical protein